MDLASISHPSRRSLILAAACLPLALRGWPALAAEMKGDELPLVTGGLEHFAMVVPDVTEAAKFYGKVFGHGLFREIEPPLRYYVMIGKAYIALGSRAGATKPFMDHYCTTVVGYNRDLMNATLEARGLPIGMRGLVFDPDRIGLQLIEDPAGLTDANIPADRLLGRGYGLVQPVGMDHVLLRAADLGASTRFYEHFFPRVEAGEPGEVWFAAADTTIRLAAASEANPAGFERCGVRVGPFDAAKVSEGLAAINATAIERTGEQAVRFRDANGLALELVKV